MISVCNLGKAYKKYPTRWSRILEWLDPRNCSRHHLKWVLQDINFTVNAGEAVGIIGINGAGKSTLLKLITGTTLATTGSVNMSGRVAAMLELGMGFHPDFTGRENVFMAGQLLGITNDDITRLLPEIEAFAEIGEYIDLPIRVYSSGMQMRLAFSVATAIRPDVLVIDEALSVGDAYFQHKSFARIRNFRDQGTTLLIVSHDKQAIQSICSKAILLNAGKQVMIDKPEYVMDFYNALLADHQDQEIKFLKSNGGAISTSSGTKDAEFTSILMKDSNGNTPRIFYVGQPVTVNVKVSIKKTIPNLVIGCGVKDRLGQMMFGTNTYHTHQVIHNPVPGVAIEMSVQFLMNLGPGSYSLHLSLHSDESHIKNSYDWRDNELVFEVTNLDKYTFAGSAWNPMEFIINEQNV